MTPTYPWAAVTLLVVGIALWLSRRRTSKQRAVHPYWFLAGRRLSGRARLATAGHWRRWLLLASMMLLALAGVGPMQEQRSVGDGSSSSQPVVGGDATFEASFLPASLQPNLGVVLVRPGTFAGASADTRVVVRDPHDAIVATAPLPAALGPEAVLELRYQGNGDELLSVDLTPRPKATMSLPILLPVPALAPLPVYLVPSLRTSAVARALAALPTITVIDSPRADAVFVTNSFESVGTQPARLAVVFLAHQPAVVDQPPQPVGAVPGTPLDRLSAAVFAGKQVAFRGLAPPDGAKPWLVAGSTPVVMQVRLAGLETILVSALADDSPGGLQWHLPLLITEIFAWARATKPVDPSAARVSGALPYRETQPMWPTWILLSTASSALLLWGVWQRPRGMALALYLGAMTLVLLTFVLGHRTSPRRHVIIADLSDSIQTSTMGRAQLQAAVVQTLRAVAPEDFVAVVGCADSAVVLLPWRRARDLDPGWQVVTPAEFVTHATHLETGLSLAEMLLAGESGELWLVSDGHDTELELEERVAPWRHRYALHYVPLSRGDLVELRASSEPAVVDDAGMLSFPVTVMLDLAAVRDMQQQLPLAVQLDVFDASGTRLRRDAHLVRDATTTWIVTLPVGDGAGAWVQVRLQLAEDAVPANNTLLIPIRRRDGPRWLTLTAAASARQRLSDEVLASLDLVVLDNVPGGSLSTNERRQLARYVELYAGTVLVSGEVAAFEPEPFLDSPLAYRLPLLPVAAAPPEQAAVVVVVDRSGSMDPSRSPDAATAAAAVDSLAIGLTPQTLVAVVGFDKLPILVRPLRLWGAVGAKDEAVSLPVTRGGTDPSAALAMAATLLDGAPAQARRLVVLVSDGDFASTFPATQRAVATLHDAGVRVATVLSGNADVEARRRMQVLGQLGGGGSTEAGRGRLTAALTGGSDAMSAQVDPTQGASGFVPQLRTSLGQPVGNVRPAVRPMGRCWAHFKAALHTDAEVLMDANAEPWVAARAFGAGAVWAMAGSLEPKNCPASARESLVAILAEHAAQRRRGSSRASLRPRFSGAMWDLDLDLAAPSMTPIPLMASLSTTLGGSVQTTYVVGLDYRGSGQYHAPLHLPRGGWLSAQIGPVATPTAPLATLAAYAPDPEFRGAGFQRLAAAASGVYRSGLDPPWVPTTLLWVGSLLAVVALMALILLENPITVRAR